MCRRMTYVVVVMMLGLAPMNPVYGYDPGSPDLLAWWTFDEGAGDIVGDASGNGNDGTLEDGPTVVEGQFGQALAFEGSRVAIGASDSLTADLFQGSFTLTAWINPTRTGNTWQQIFRSIRADDTSNDTLFINNGGKLSWRGRVGGAWTGGMCETAPHVVPADHWTHVAVTGDGTNFRIYVNGALSEESAFQTTDGENSTYYIGGDPKWTGESYTGMIDDVRIYNMALTGLEILVAMEGVEQVDMEIGFVAHPPVIDGEADGTWADASTQYIDNMSALARIDTFVSWKALYDFENLYVIVDIIDDNLVNDSDSSWQDDSVEFYFDGGNTKDGAPLSGDNRQYTFGWTTEDIQGTNTRTEGVEHAQVDTGSGWRIEIKLPWLSLQDAEPQARDLIGIDCFYNDDDDGGDTLEDQIWTFATDGRAWNNASQWGTAILTVDKRVDVTAPGDLVQGVPNDGLTDGSGNFGWKERHTPDLAIDDNTWTKYLHFKGETETTGFQVTPTSGPSIVTGLTLTTANDFPARDPIAFELSGSNDSIDGPYELIDSGYIVDFAHEEAWPRFTMNATPISFYNDAAYAHYQLLFPVIRNAAIANSMQIAEVELLGVPAPAPEPGGANIILVTEAIDWDLDGLRDDHSLESFLVSEGYNVDVRPDYWKLLTPDKIAELNAADLIIISRLAWSDRYDEGNETSDWNSLATPLLMMNPNFARNTRWKWVNSWAGAPADNAPYIYAEIVDLLHPIFIDMLLSSFDPDGQPDVVQMIDPLIGTGLTSFIGGTDMGNGRLIAKSLELDMGWIAEWDVGVEFFDGAGQYAGGRRMLFCAGTQEIQYYDYDRQEVITTAQGELNLTVEGLQMFRNAIDYLLNSEFAEGIFDPKN